MTQYSAKSGTFRKIGRPALFIPPIALTIIVARAK